MNDQMMMIADQDQENLKMLMHQMQVRLSIYVHSLEKAADKASSVYIWDRQPYVSFAA